MQILELSSFPIEQHPDLDGLERRLGEWFAQRSYPVRLLAASQGFPMEPVIAHVRQVQAREVAFARRIERFRREVAAFLVAEPDAHPLGAFQALSTLDQGALLDLFGTTDALRAVLLADALDDCDAPAWLAIAEALDALLWRVPWAQEMERFYTHLGEQHLRSARYLLLTWEPPEVNSAAIANSLRHVTGRAVRRLDALPSVLNQPYQVRWDRPTKLFPLVPPDSYMAVLLSYDARGDWNATTLHTLFDVSFDVQIAVDVHTFTKEQTRRKAELAFGTARAVASDARVIDTRAQRIQTDAQRVLHEYAHTSLHDVQIAVLVCGETEEALETNVADLRERMGSSLRLMRPAFVQKELLKYWSLTPTAQIDAPRKTRNMLSQGVGCVAGLLGYHRARATSGIFWGVDSVRLAPLFFDLFQNNQAAHMVILGRTGSGKTYFLNVLALRGAALSGYQVIGIDAFKNGLRVEAAAGAGARCFAIGLDNPVNILDVVYSVDVEGGWLPNQVQHVIGQLSLLMGQPGRSPQGKEQYIPRVFTLAERGLLDRALVTLYTELAIEPTTPLNAMPILGDLIVRLEARREVEAQLLARELRLLLFGSEDQTETTLSSLGQSFNAHTTVDWQFGADITYYDFSGVPELLRPFYYLQAIGAINRYMRDPKRDRTRKILLQIDEFGYASQVEAVARLAVDICKTARKYGVGIILIDQNPLTFVETESGRQIIENAVAKVLFRLDVQPARQMADALGDLTERHIEFITHAQPGECVAVVGNDVYVVAVESSPKERRALIGS